MDSHLDGENLPKRLGVVKQYGGGTLDRYPFFPVDRTCVSRQGVWPEQARALKEGSSE
jgi:hypothetical protein